MLLLVVTALFSCKVQKENTQVIIISTNDIHAQIDRFPLFATFVKQKRAEYKNVIVVDAGDRFSGNPYVDNAAEKGRPMISLMNEVGYDVAAMGNHDFDYGQETLKKRIDEARFPVLCGNIESANSKLGKLPPYQIVEKEGIKFCFFSLIQTGSQHIPATNPGNLENISFKYYKDAAQEYKELEKQADVLIGLTHLGFYNDSLLAVVMPELDVIVGGHSHTLIRNGRTVNGVLINQAGSQLNYAGVTTLHFKGNKLVDKSYSVVKLSDIGQRDPETELVVEEIKNQPAMKEVVGKAVREMKYKENVASMVTDAMCDRADCDFAFYNKGGIRLNRIAEGDITREMIYKIEPFGNYIVVHEWTLDEMEEFILRDFNRSSDKEKRYINYFISSGKYEIVRDNAGNGVQVRFYDKEGKELKDRQKKYKLAFSNYVDSSNPYVKEKNGRQTDILIAEATIGYVTKVGNIACTERRTFIK